MRTATTKTTAIAAYDVQPGDIISVNGGSDYLRVWAIADNLNGGRNVGIKFEERADGSRRRLYVNLRGENTVLLREEVV